MVEREEMGAVLGHRYVVNIGLKPRWRLSWFYGYHK